MAEAGGTRTTSRVARQARIVALIENHEIGSQSELADLLGAEGISISEVFGIYRFKRIFESILFGCLF